MTQRSAFAHRRLRTRKGLRISCASAALAAAALAPQSAHAQALGAFRGTVTGTTGTVTRNPVSNTAETITVGSSTATINWSPSGQQQGGGALDFLPSGNTATFTSAQGITDYTVLNRIVPDSGQPVALNGHVVSTLQGTSATGGNVWFYSPNGIIVGSSAVFDVGSLLLTTNDVTSFGTKPDGFTATFSGPAASTSKIQIQNGAQINALQQNSYVALVAPRIEQGGKVRVNGSAAYAAGEQLTMTMNQGLFDIQVDVGTSDYNGVVHTGETSGPANASAADNHKIYMVAVPKNQAMTMLLGGTVGFDDASSATVKNGEIVLSSGWGVHDSDGSGQVYVSTAGLDAGVDVGPGNYTSDVTGFGQSLIEASAESGDINFGGDLNLTSWSGVGYSEVSLIAGGDYQLNIAGAAHLSSAGGYDSVAAGDAAGQDGYGGDVYIDAYDGGSISTGGNLLIEAYGSGQSATGTGTGGSGHGGTIYIDADYGGSISVGGDFTANVNGVGGNAVGQAGDGHAGTFDLSIYGGNMSVGGDVNIWANGFGGNGLTAGSGFGGSASADLESAEAGTGSSLSVTKDFSMQAAGQGGTGIDNLQGAGGQGGDGYGGNAWFYIDNYATDATVTFSAANAEVMANATGGNGGNGITGGNGGVGSANGYYGGGDCTECYYVGTAQFELYGGTATIGDLLV
jgi:filamentous hemagglutinin family protein